MVKSVYDIIKKQNGEGFARVLRDKGLLDIPDVVGIVKYAGHTAQDANQLFPYLWSLKNFQETETTTRADPFQLLDQAGYHAYEVHNLEEQNSLRRFFRKDEELCTFRDMHRYENNYIIHAVKHDVWRNRHAIRPAKNPQRQDEYGTSVISIQIRKSGGFISIKNRYNHTVDNPDQTFNSNPDEIIDGLSAALKIYFDVDWQSTGVRLPDGFILNGNQILKTNFEINNHYIGDGFYTQGDSIIDIDKSNQVQLDYFIWDNQQKRLLNPLNQRDTFPKTFNNFIQNKKVTLLGKAPNQTILVDGEKIIEIENNHIVTLNMPHLTTVEYNFLFGNKHLRSISLPNVTTIGSNFLYNNLNLQSISLPNASTISFNFLRNNKNLKSIDLPKVTEIGKFFLYYNENLQSLSLPMAEIIGDYFLAGNYHLHLISLPNVKTIGSRFLNNNSNLQSISLPKVTEIGDAFLCCNEILQSLSLPMAEIIGRYFLQNNKNVKSIDLPKVTEIDSNFLCCNENLQSLSLPVVVNIGAEFLVKNNQIKHLYAPNLESVSYYFLLNNTALSQIDLPSLKSVGEQFLASNKQIQWANLPNLESAGALFLRYNKKLKRLSLPNLTSLADGFMENNNSVILDVPRLNSVAYNSQSRPATPAVNTPITDIIPERRNIAQKFRAAIKKLYGNITITYNNQFGNDK